MKITNDKLLQIENEFLLSQSEDDFNYPWTLCIFKSMPDEDHLILTLQLDKSKKSTTIVSNGTAMQDYIVTWENWVSVVKLLDVGTDLLVDAYKKCENFEE